MTGYLYRGRPDLEAQNAAIMASRTARDSRGAMTSVAGLIWKRADGRCRNGHLWTPENTKARADGTRRCRACRAANQAQRRKDTAA